MPQRSVGSAVQEPAKLETRGRGAVSGAGNEDAAGGKGLLDGIWNPLQTMAKRTAIYVAFLAAKQPSRIKQVLRQVRSCFSAVGAVLVVVFAKRTPLLKVCCDREGTLGMPYLRYL